MPSTVRRPAVRRKTPARPQKTRSTAKKTKKDVPIEDDECILFHNWLKARDIDHTHIPNDAHGSCRRWDYHEAYGIMRYGCRYTTATER